MDMHNDADLGPLGTRSLGHVAFPRVYIDATYVKARVAGRAVFEAIVVAFGVTRQGTVEVLGFDVGDSEDRRFWERFLHGLRLRGLHGVERLIASEDHAGLEAAVGTVLPATTLEVVPDDPLFRKGALDTAGSVPPNLSVRDGGPRVTLPSVEGPRPRRSLGRPPSRRPSA